MISLYLSRYFHRLSLYCAIVTGVARSIILTSVAQTLLTWEMLATFHSIVVLLCQCIPSFILAKRLIRMCDSTAIIEEHSCDWEKLARIQPSSMFTLLILQKGKLRPGTNSNGGSPSIKQLFYDYYAWKNNVSPQAKCYY